MQGHNRYWSPKTTYATVNGGAFNFTFNGPQDSKQVQPLASSCVRVLMLCPPWRCLCEQVGVPTQQEFWDFLMSSSKEWGLAVYEQVQVVQASAVTHGLMLLCAV